MQAQIKSEVDKLLALKAQFKSTTGQDWSPDAAVSSSPAQVTSITPALLSIKGPDISSLHCQIKAQGDRVRDLKSAKAQKVDISCYIVASLRLVK